jgi:PAS domain S-box-containing protein
VVDPAKPDSGKFRAAADALRPDSGAFKAVASPQEAELQQAAGQMLLVQKPEEIIRVLCEAARRYTGARDATVFLCGPGPGALSGGDPRLLPEAAVIDYVFEEAKPPTVPHGDGGFITVLPIRVPQERLGVLVLDATGMAEEISRMSLEPLAVLAEQAAVLLQSGRAMSRSIGEQALLSNILDSITNAIITLDIDSRITRINRNAMAMLELGHDVVGRRYDEALPPEVVTALNELMRETHHYGYAMEKMVSARLPQGLEINIAVSTAMLRDENFAPIGTILVLRDMTASRELDRLRKLDQMKSEFVANVSHELKTPLTSIKAYTEALLDMASEEQVKSFLKVIDEESDRLLYLINDLLNVSRIQSGKMKMHFEKVKPRTCIDDILNISKIQSEKHRLELEIAPDLPEMLLDREKMKEVMVNLIGNAIKYSPKGGDVTVRLRREESNLRIEVRDQGIGIPEEHQKNLFQAFYRVDSSHTAEIPGTGLGLVICKAIVEHHGGKIWLESKPGRGTTFFILIPIRTEIHRGQIGSELGSMA